MNLLKLCTFAIASLATMVGWAQPAKKASNNSLLWKISGKDLKKPSYLFGTIHLICADDYLWTDKMKETLTLSEKVCLEMDMDDPGLMMTTAKGLMDNSGKTLKDYFSEADYARLAKYVEDKTGLDIALFSQMKPIALQTLLGTKGSGCVNQVSYEERIMKLAQDGQKEVIGLELPEEQLKVLESIPIDTVIKQLLEDMAGNNSENDSTYAELIAAYKQQNLVKLNELITTADEPSMDMGLFLDERNKKWIPRMTTKMKTSSVFFAVGAGHLGGKTGVISLLRKDGYTVVPLN